jgi:hypothetical protein
MARYIGLEIKKCLEWKTAQDVDMDVSEEVKGDTKVKGAEESPCKPSSSAD